jgi:hypothetical protein
MKHPVLCDVIFIALLLLLSHYVMIFYVCQLICSFIVIKSIKNKRLTYSAPEKTELLFIITVFIIIFLQAVLF